MELLSRRFASGSDSTLSICHRFDVPGNPFVGFVCEDQHQEEKVRGETCIPALRYEIKLRNEGGMNKRYKNKWPRRGYPEIHRGMLWLQEVPNFDWIYIHVGNTDDHTDGCLLFGYDCNHDPVEGGGSVGQSVDCYIALYKMCLESFDNGQQVFITIQEGLL